MTEFDFTLQTPTSFNLNFNSPQNMILLLNKRSKFPYLYFQHCIKYYVTKL